jgi:hypothetical protein
VTKYRSARASRLAFGTLAILASLFAAHVQLNMGGWPRFLHRMRSGAEVRGELVVGFLPVT